MMNRFNTPEEPQKQTVKKIKKVKKPKDTLYGHRIAEILKAKEMSSQELSDISGVLPSLISRILNGKRRCLSTPTAIRIAQALGEPVEYVFMLNDPEKKDNTEHDGN